MEGYSLAALESSQPENFNRLYVLLWAMGSFAAMNALAALAPNFQVPLVARIGLAMDAGLFVPGANALAVGVILGGRRVDRLVARAAIVPALTVCSISFVALSTFSHALSPSVALVPILVAIITWSASHRGF